MIRVGFKISKKMLNIIDVWIGKEGLYTSRSEVFRAALKDYFLDEEDQLRTIEEINRLQKDPIKPKWIDNIPHRANKEFVHVPHTDLNGTTQMKRYNLVHR